MQHNDPIYECDRCTRDGRDVSVYESKEQGAVDINKFIFVGRSVSATAKAKKEFHKKLAFLSRKGEGRPGCRDSQDVDRSV